MKRIVTVELGHEAHAPTMDSVTTPSLLPGGAGAGGGAPTHRQRQAGETRRGERLSRVEWWVDVRGMWDASAAAR
jgi:hypothetical protein